MTRPTVMRADLALVDGVLQPAVVRLEGPVITSVLTVADLPLTAPEDCGDADLVDVPAGALLLPGNVDSHVHVNEPGRTKWEDFRHTTDAAARGGITCLVDMPLSSIPSTVDPGSPALSRAVASRQLHVDVAFWGGAAPENLGDLAPAWSGMSSLQVSFPSMVDAALLAHRNRLSAYTGGWLTGSVSRSVVLGRTVFDGTAVGEPSGRYLDRPGASGRGGRR